jgi:hypothetical protein
MPNRWAISSGNWSDSAIWSGSLIPTASDDVWANGFNIFVDQDITVKTLRNHPVTTPLIAAGGSFINTGSRTITCTLTNAGSGSVFGGFVNYQSTASVLIVTGSDTVNIVSDIMGGLLPSPYGNSVVIRNSGVVNITGSIAGYVLEGLSINTIGGGTVNISGSIRGNYLRAGGGANSTGITCYVNKTINIIGDVIGETNVGGNAITTAAGQLITVNLDVKGNVYSKSSLTSIAQLSAGTLNLTVTGSVYCQLSTTAAPISANAGTLNTRITGSVIAGPLVSAISTTSAVPGSSFIEGPIYAGFSQPGVQFAASTYFLTATGPFYNVNNRNAVFAQNLQLISGSTPTWTFDTETYGEQRTLYTQNYPGNFPTSSNVRQGVTFGDTGQFTGTVAIPSASNVLRGVPVDNTTGSASFTTQNVWNVPTASLTVTGSVGERLRNTATVASDGAAIASKGNL